jgi:hypothetical protein
MLEPITIKKGDKRIPEAAYLGKPDPGNVSFDFKNADLAKMVIPLFGKQAGVILEYGGPPKKLDLRLVNVPWRDALLMICQFTQTHVTEGELAGHLEMKLGFSDSRTILDRYNPKKAPKDESSSAPGTPAATGPGSAPSTSSDDSIQDPDAKAKDQIEKLRTGVSTTNSGGK